jgi:riboflavin synthase
MFTGIIEETGIIRSIRQGNRSSELTVSADLILTEIKTGDSICTNGICLTVTRFDQHSFTVDVMPETMMKTSLGLLKAGHLVNLERALRLCDRLGGHLVSGHIDGTGIIKRILQDDNAIRFDISADPSMLRYIVEKGSVAIDGISLTVTHVNDELFGVSVIPHTRKTTTLFHRKTGDKVNIECDMIAKYTEKLTTNNNSNGQRRISLEFLTNNGYL